MKRSLFSVVTVGILTVLAGNAPAKAQESFIRQAEQDRNVKLPGVFTIQGYQFNDVAEVVYGNGQMAMRATLWDLIFSPFMRDWYVSSSGQVVVRLGFEYPQPAFHLGTVSIYHGRALLDCDRIRLD